METSSQHEVSSLSAYLRVLRRRKWIVLACVILAPLTAYVVSARQTALYQSSAQVYLSSQDLAAALTGISSGYVDRDSGLPTPQRALPHVPAVAQDAIPHRARVQGPESPQEALLGSTEHRPADGGTDILTFTVTNDQPDRAVLLANAYAEAFTRYRGRLDSDAVRRARAELKGRLQALEASGQAARVRSRRACATRISSSRRSRPYRPPEPT